MPRLQTFAAGGRLVSDVDTRTIEETRADKVVGLRAALGNRLEQLFPPIIGDTQPLNRQTLLMMIGRVVTASAEELQTLAALRSAVTAHYQAIMALQTIAEIDAYDMGEGWPS